MKEDSLYFGVFLKVVYNCIWKMTHLCIKLRKLKYINRNWLLHGRSYRDVERYECIQVLNALDAIESVLV